MHPAYRDVLCNTYVKNNEELYSTLERIFEGSLDYYSTAKAINSYINAESLRKGGYCKNVSQYILKEIGL